MKACIISFNGVGAPGKHAPALAPLILRPIFVENNAECDIIDAALLARENSIDGMRALVDYIAWLASHYDLIAATTRCETYPILLSTLSLAKKLNRSAITLLGGPQATATAEATMLAYPQIDFILAGEAEVSLRTLLQAMILGASLVDVPGLVHRNAAGTVTRTEFPKLISDWNQRPFPDYVYYASRYSGHEFEFREVELGRGCPFQCNFCFTTQMWRQNYRVRSPVYLVRELRFLMEHFGSNGFHLIHDNLIIKRGAGILELCRELGEIEGLRWAVSSRIDTIDIDLLPFLANAGLKNLFVGIETGSEHRKRELKKRWDIDTCLDTIETCHELGIGTTTSFIVGFPRETRGEMIDTLNFASRCAMTTGRVDTQIHAFALEAGTELFSVYAKDVVYTGSRGDHILMPWPLDGGSLLAVKKNPQVFSSFHTLPCIDGPQLPYVIQDSIGPAFNVFRGTIRMLLSEGLTIQTLLDTAEQLYPHQEELVNRLACAERLVGTLVQASNNPQSQASFYFEATCIALVKGEQPKYIDNSFTEVIKCDDLDADVMLFRCRFDARTTCLVEDWPKDRTEAAHYLLQRLPGGSTFRLWILNDLQKDVVLSMTREYSRNTRPYALRRRSLDPFRANRISSFLGELVSFGLLTRATATNIAAEVA